MLTPATTIGRPRRDDIDMPLVRSMLATNSIRQIGRLLGIHFSTINHRLKVDGFHRPLSPNPFCVVDRTRMGRISKRGKSYFRCLKCGNSTLYRGEPAIVVCSHRIGRPPKPLDVQRASDLLQKHSVIEVASLLGVSRNVLYYRINKAASELRVAGRPFRTWTPRFDRDYGLACWPYMESGDPRYEGVIREVNEAVPRTFEDAIRADVCQELLLSVLSGEIKLEEIKSAAIKHVRRHFKLFPIKSYTTISLDAPIRSRNPNGEERKIIDCIDSETYQNRSAILRYGDSLSDCSTVGELADRLADGWEANRLTTRPARNFSTVSRSHERQAVSDVELDSLRRKYKLIKGRVYQFPDYSYRGTFGPAWSPETAPPEELREQHTT